VIDCRNVPTKLRLNRERTMRTNRRDLVGTGTSLAVTAAVIPVAFHCELGRVDGFVERNLWNIEALLRLDVCGLDDWPPFLDLGLL
jgi:hypothetical protein